MTAEKTKIALIEQALENIQKVIDGLKETYVSLERYSPVEKIVYGLVSLILITIITYIITSILK